MEATEIADNLTEAHDHAHEAEVRHTASSETFRKRVGVYIGALAAVLAITSLGGGYAMKETINNNIQVSDNYAFYQARKARETATVLAIDELESLLLSRPDLPAEATTAIRAKIETDRKSLEHFASSPATGDGEKELLAKAETLKQKRNASQARDINFDFAEALMQIAIVIASVSILSASRSLLLISIISACFAILLSLNGFFLFVDLPSLGG